MESHCSTGRARQPASINLCLKRDSRTRQWRTGEQERIAHRGLGSTDDSYLIQASTREPLFQHLVSTRLGHQFIHVHVHPRTEILFALRRFQQKELINLMMVTVAQTQGCDADVSERGKAVGCLKDTVLNGSCIPRLQLEAGRLFDLDPLFHLLQPHPVGERLKFFAQHPLHAVRRFFTIVQLGTRKIRLWHHSARLPLPKLHQHLPIPTSEKYHCDGGQAFDDVWRVLCEGAFAIVHLLFKGIHVTLLHHQAPEPVGLQYFQSEDADNTASLAVHQHHDVTVISVRNLEVIWIGRSRWFRSDKQFVESHAVALEERAESRVVTEHPLEAAPLDREELTNRDRLHRPHCVPGRPKRSPTEPATLSHWRLRGCLHLRSSRILHVQQLSLDHVPCDVKLLGWEEDTVLLHIDVKTDGVGITQVLKHSDVHLFNQTEELVSQEVRPAELCPQLCSQRLRQQCGGFDIFKGKRSSVIHAFLHLAFDAHAQASADVVLTQEPVECGQCGGPLLTHHF
mmetsp:Transcript_15067/g.41425  ORF Transcript_15067/g.41425 Transcript_15067/m.41425 type:complete len:512 (-) Transcript_15067:475-2010(-)